MVAKTTDKTVDKAAADTTTPPEQSGPAEGAAPAATPAEVKANTPAARKARGECVVDDGTPHTGRAVNGVICSAHAMRYHADGTPRA